MSRGFKKPGFSKMGYSQRIMQDKKTRNTYGGVKFSNIRKPSRNNLKPVKGDQAAYENALGGSNFMSQLESGGSTKNSKAAMGLRSKNSHSGSFKGLTNRSSNRPSSSRGTNNDGPIPFEDFELPDLTSDFIGRKATPSTDFRTSATQSMKSGDVGVEDPEHQYGQRERYLNNVVASLQ
jgi:hypothetical protein